MSYNQQSYGQGPPDVPYPWDAEWDYESNSWIFINRESGQRTYEYPTQFSTSNQSYTGASQQYDQEISPAESHACRNAALGAMAGLAGGGLLMHEGGNIEKDWDNDKANIESEAANLPENAATWTGEKVQEVEDLPEEIGGWAGRKVDDVEEVPQTVENGFENALADVEGVTGNVADWAGRNVGEVEGVGDDVDQYGYKLDDAYDAGRDEERYDDNTY